MFFKTYGVLGINARSLKYIKTYNNEVSRSLADSKLKTKEFLKTKGVNVPQTLKIIKKHEELTTEMIAALVPPFVVKPNNGFGGKGILVVDSVDHAGSFVTNTGEMFTVKKMQIHLSNILDGFFSLSGSRDKVLVEKKVILDTDVALLGKYGLPDIRIILFNMIPVMAMIRIPTEKSGGKANLHSGACAAGIDIGSGRLTYIVQKGKQIKTIPGIGNVRGLKLPDWDKTLELAVKVQFVSGVKYVGCDIVLDEHDGPLLLEMNIRPGLEVQVVNNAPLHARLKKVEGIEVHSVEKGVRLGRDLFSGDLEERVKNITGKNILGVREYVSLERKEKTYKYIAEIRASTLENFIDKDFLEETLGLTDIDEGVRFKATLLHETKNMRFLIKKDLGSKITIGSKSLRGFLIDPYKYKKGELPTDIDAIGKLKIINSSIIKNYKDELQKIDKALIGIDKKLVIVTRLIPKNIDEQRHLFVESKGGHVPIFTYDNVDLDFDVLLQNVNAVDIPEIPLSDLYVRKKEEIINKILFLKAFSENEPKDMTLYSKKIFGDITVENVEKALELIKQKGDLETEKKIGLSEIRDFVKKFNHIYNINIGVSERSGGSRFAIKGNKLLIKRGTFVGKKELRSIVAHEIEGHFLRKVNGKKQPLQIFFKGSAGYIETDEGIAIYNQNRFLTMKDSKYYGIFERYYFMNYSLNHSYKKLLAKMLEYYDNDYARVFNYILRLKRGMRDVSKDGLFYKDVVYLNGYVKVQDYMENGGDLKDLYMGKVKISDIEEIKESGLVKINSDDLKVPFFS